MSKNGSTRSSVCCPPASPCLAFTTMPNRARGACRKPTPPRLTSATTDVCPDDNRRLPARPCGVQRQHAAVPVICDVPTATPKSPGRVNPRDLRVVGEGTRRARLLRRRVRRRTPARTGCRHHPEGQDREGRQRPPSRVTTNSPTLKIKLGQELHFGEAGGGVLEQVTVPVAQVQVEEGGDVHALVDDRPLRV